MHDIIKQTEKEFCVEILGFTKYRESFLLSTHEGTMILKKQYKDAATVTAFAEISSFLYDAGFNKIEFYKLANGLPYIECGGNLYTLAFCGEGKACIFTEIEQTKKISAALAEIHLLQKGLDYNVIPWSVNAYPRFYLKRVAEMRHIKKWLDNQSSFTDADILFITNYKKFLKYAEKSTEVIIRHLSENPKRMCVSKIKEDNILIDQNGNVTFINMENFSLTIACTDLCELIRRFIKRGGDASLVDQIISAYSEVKPLNSDELSFIYAYLSFPYKFFSLANKYYNSKKIFNKSSHYAKLKNCTAHQNKVYEILET